MDCFSNIFFFFVFFFYESLNQYCISNSNLPECDRIVLNTIGVLPETYKKKLVRSYNLLNASIDGSELAAHNAFVHLVFDE